MTHLSPAERPDPQQVGELLGKIVGHRHVDQKPTALAKIGLPADRPGTSAWLVRPGSTAEIAELIQLANRYRIAVVAVGNAARAPRAAPLGDKLHFLVDIRRMNHVLHLDETSLVVHVQAGLTALALENVLAPRGLTLGDYSPRALGSTIGGLLSFRTPGMSSPRHGFIENAMIGVSAVLADGRAIHTRVAPRRATGPDLARVLCGSEGTLGIITSAVLRIHRLPEARFLAAYALPSFATALSAVHLTLREEATPAAIRVLDFAEAQAQLGPGVAEKDEAILVLATAGPTDLAACDRDLCASAVSAVGGRVLAEEIAQRWWRRRMDQASRASRPVPTFQVTASPGREAAVYEAVIAAAQGAEASARASASRFDADGAVLSFTLVVAGDGVPAERSTAAQRAAEAAAEEAGAVRWGAANRSLMSYYAALRGALDPRGVMNPGADSIAAAGDG